jgi:hypothetical protein
MNLQLPGMYNVLRWLFATAIGSKKTKALLPLQWEVQRVLPEFLNMSPNNSMAQQHLGKRFYNSDFVTSAAHG